MAWVIVRPRSDNTYPPYYLGDAPVPVANSMAGDAIVLTPEDPVTNGADADGPPYLSSPWTGVAPLTQATTLAAAAGITPIGVYAYDLGSTYPCVACRLTVTSGRVYLRVLSNQACRFDPGVYDLIVDSTAFQAYTRIATDASSAEVKIEYWNAHYLVDMVGAGVANAVAAYGALPLYDFPDVPVPPAPIGYFWTNIVRAKEQ